MDTHSAIIEGFAQLWNDGRLLTGAELFNDNRSVGIGKAVKVCLVEGENYAATGFDCCGDNMCVGKIFGAGMGYRENSPDEPSQHAVSVAKF